MFIGRGLGKYATVKSDLISYLIGKCVCNKWFSEKKLVINCMYNRSKCFLLKKNCIRMLRKNV